MSLQAGQPSRLPTAGSDSDEQAVPTWQPARPAGWRIATVASALLMSAGVLALGKGAPQVPMTRVAANPGLTQLHEDKDHDDDPCGKMPLLHLVKVINNNLGGHGPEKNKPEGIFYKVNAENTGLNGTEKLEVHLHAVTEGYFGSGATEGTNVTGPYDPQWPKTNGITGHFGTINVHPGTNVTLQLHGYDATKKSDIHLPAFAMTFFDLDTGKDGKHSVEFLKVNNFKHYFVTNETEIDIAKEEDGATKFVATKEGTGHDNPTTPLRLTPLQKNRAVSMVFEDQKEVIFQVGASKGDTARVFQFVVRPILRCAYTELPDGTLLAADDPNSPISLVEGSGGVHTRFSLALAMALGLLSAQRWF